MKTRYKNKHTGTVVTIVDSAVTNENPTTITYTLSDDTKWTSTLFEEHFIRLEEKENVS